MRGELAIRRVICADALTVRDLRLRALAIDPVAFGENERVKTADDSFWLYWTKQHASGTDDSIVIALLDGHPIAMIRASRDRQDATRFSVHSLRTAPEARRQGIAGVLLAEIENWIRNAAARGRASSSPTHRPQRGGSIRKPDIGSAASSTSLPSLV